MSDFGICVLAFILADTWLHSRGMDTFLWSYKTDEEKEIQRKIIEKMK